MGIVLQKKRFIVSQMVIFSKEPPDTAGHFRSAVVPLTGLYVGKLIYELLCIFPVMLGNGIPLFPPSPALSKWQLEEQRSFPSGATMLTYKLS